MIKQLITLTIIIVLTFSCKNNTDKKVTTKKTTINNPYLGSWSRDFQMSSEVTATVTYTFFNDSIQYQMKGPMNLNYTIKKDTFLIKENKWIGKKDQDTYAIFIKKDTEKSITLLKMKVKDKLSAIKMPFPSDTARSKFSSWNTYNKK